MTPVYLSQIFNLKQTDKNTWDLLSNGGFCVNKSKVPFTSIGADHGIEQENRALKVTGGIRGIANNQQALNEYFLTTAEMGNIVESFCQTFGIEEDGSRKRDEHYQLTGSKNKRIRTYTDKISTVFTVHEVAFNVNATNELESSEGNENDTPETEIKDDVFNVLTKKVLPDKMAETFIKVEEIGEKRYKSFIADKLEGKVPV